MPKTNSTESQTLEFKRQWTDRALEDLAAFANTAGVTLLLGIRVTSETLYGPYSSVLPNLLFAQTFHFAGVIECWSTGTTRIIRLCREQGLPVPQFAHWQGGVRVTFLKDPYTPERLRRMGLNERQVKTVLYVKEHGRITNKEFQKISEVSKPTATRDLESLVSAGIIRRKGTIGRGVHNVLRAHKRLKGLLNGSKRAQRGNKGTLKGQNGVDRGQDA